MIRTGFWAHYTIIMIRNPQNSIALGCENGAEKATSATKNDRKSLRVGNDSKNSPPETLNSKP